MTSSIREHVYAFDDEGQCIGEMMVAETDGRVMVRAVFKGSSVALLFPPERAELLASAIEHAARRMKE